MQEAVRYDSRALGGALRRRIGGRREARFTQMGRDSFTTKNSDYLIDCPADAGYNLTD
jgi:hypothetical protein